MNKLYIKKNNQNTELNNKETELINNHKIFEYLEKKLSQ